MALIRDDQNNGFSFIWTVQNFSYCLQKTGEFLESPPFKLNSNNPEMSLGLYPRGNKDEKVYIILNTVVIGQKKLSNYFIPIERVFDYVFSIRTVRGAYKQISANARWDSSRPDSVWDACGKQDILKKSPDAFLDNDTLTIRCRIMKVEDIVLETEQCYARTIVGVERAINTWNLKTLRDLEPTKHETKKQINLPQISSFNVNVSVTKGLSSEDKVEIIIKRGTNTRQLNASFDGTNKLCFSTCEISLLDSGKVLHSTQNEHWFEKSVGEQIWTISFFPKTNFLANPKDNSTIYLRLEFVVSLGNKYSTIDKTVYGSTVDDSVVFPKPTMGSDKFGSCSTVDRPLEISKPAIDSDILGSWKYNMLCFYSVGEFSDFTIRTPRKQFAVHKALLSAQSPVFRAMFKRDMKENRTGFVEIEDLEDNTVSMMLLFVYTSSVANLGWENASKLYFAADKYEMAALKEKCSVFLKENLSTSNACKCLILADTHQDQELKSCVQDFIVGHSKGIFGSYEWKELMKENSNLAAETMHLAFMRN